MDVLHKDSIQVNLSVSHDGNHPSRQHRRLEETAEVEWKDGMEVQEDYLDEADAQEKAKSARCERGEMEIRRKMTG